MAGSPVSSTGLRVAYVLSLRNGIHSFIYRELEELERRGIGFTIFAVSTGDGPYQPKVRWKVVKPTAFRAFSGLLLALAAHPVRMIGLALRAATTRSVVDFGIALAFLPAFLSSGLGSVHAHFGDHKLFVGHYLHRFLDVPLTATIHAYELYMNPNPQMFRKALDSCARILTVSQYNKDILRAKYGVDPSCISVVRLFPWTVTEISKVPANDGFTILCVARFAPKKGHDVLLKAVRRLEDLGHCDVRLVLVGKGTVDVPRLVRAYGLGSRTTILSDINESALRAEYARANVFCLPSRTSDGGDREGIPVSLMEAMAYGLPVVTTAHAGIPELVRETLVPEGDPEALAEALIRLKTHPELAEAQGRVNRETVQRDYSPRNVDELIAVLRRVQNAAQ
ncbi:MAG TPA: glycosyltransferase family 4 protein [Thermoplasmata archaeon]